MTVSTKQWPKPPAMTIDAKKHYRAILKTAKGDIEVDLLADKAPKTVNNFVFLARDGFYDHTTFHRVITDFMAQGGDPTGTGRGGPGYKFDDEIARDVRFDSAGILAMANAGPNTNGSQFFITYAATPWLNGKHTIFGRVTKGMDAARRLTVREPQTARTPGDELLTIEIHESEYGARTAS